MSEVQKHVSNPIAEITLSDSAKAHILSYLGKPEHKAFNGIRLSVKKTGCSGLSYVVDYVSSAQPQDIIQSIDNKVHLCIDLASYPVLKGSHMDYVKDRFNAKFVFTNPNQTGQCGCGESFIVE